MKSDVIFFVTSSQLAQLAALRDNPNVLEAFNTSPSRTRRRDLTPAAYFRLIRKGLVTPGCYAGQAQLTPLGHALVDLLGSTNAPPGHSRRSASTPPLFPA